jgi:hypothetical protein
MRKLFGCLGVVFFCAAVIPAVYLFLVLCLSLEVFK